MITCAGGSTCAPFGIAACASFRFEAFAAFALAAVATSACAISGGRSARTRGTERGGASPGGSICAIRVSAVAIRTAGVSVAARLRVTSSRNRRWVARPCASDSAGTSSLIGGVVVPRCGSSWK